jgi:HAD superfamily hydrolase (TIGR01456 family)
MATPLTTIPISEKIQISPITQSYLNNDNIDQLTPQPRKKNVSSISLSDQFVSAFPSMQQLDNNINNLSLTSKNNAFLSLSIPRLSFNNMALSPPPKFKKSIIDHHRVASYAFAFDIDGVLVRGPDTLNSGIEAIKYLDGENPYNIKVPYIFVTNGGGKHESVRAEDLSNRLKTDITSDQIVQGHTPMKDLSNSYNNVLVVGGMGNTCRNVAKNYGFKNVYTPLDIMKWDPSVTPYYSMTDEDLKFCECTEDIDFSKIKIDAIMVFADSRNWAADQQIILELLMSKNGYMGTISDSFEDGPPIYFAHSDFVWATNYRLVRYGMGALQVSIAALFKEHTGKELKVIRFGKPQRSTFKYAEKVLHTWRKSILNDHIEELTSSSGSVTQTSDLFSSIDDDKYKSVFDSESEEKDESEDDEEEDSNLNEGGALTFQSLTKLKLSPNPSQGSTTPTTNNLKSGSFSTVEDLPPPSTVYFVGDTPESDIRFANSHDESWYSILVNTGVYNSNTVPKYAPKKQCNDVLEAVKFAVEREHQKELEEWNKSALEF